MGVMDKIVLKFEKQWWPDTAAFFIFLWKGEDKRRINAEDYWTTRIFACSTPTGSKNALTLWTSGDIGKMVSRSLFVFRKSIFITGSLVSHH